ncbi:MAG: N-methylhydantoinase [Acidimicrobiaceae bacterium]|nr:N-methylhydantoinase [Acidimicrobiaceae bacterium]
MKVGVDTGGTFTDVVADDGRIVKVPSTPADPGAAVREGVSTVWARAGRPELMAHGTTVATNALLERRGAVVALVTNEGMADVIEIARQDRPSLYDIWADRPTPLVRRELRFEVGGRLAADGSEVSPVDPGAVPALPDDVESVCVCLLHSDLNPAHERLVRAVLSNRGFDVTCSHEVSPEFREYERTVTTVVNAYVRPTCRAYLRTLADVADSVLVLTSAGGLMPVDAAAERPAALLLSGPAGGVRAAAAAGVAAGFADCVTFDMGGTSTDVCLVRDGKPEFWGGGRDVGGFPVRLPSLDIHTIGAGGGSMARVDAGGALVVGPESAGAEPGPACYGRGGTEPTVTDADLVAGRIPADAAFGGLGRLSVDAARAALDGAGVSAEGVIDVVDAAMVEAVRAVTVARGVDPRQLALVAFGGAGPLHACAIAAQLDMQAVVVPARAGVLSAVGLLGSPPQEDVVLSWPDPLDHAPVASARFELARVAARRLLRVDDDVSVQVTLSAVTGGAVARVGERSVEVSMAVDCRYAGQSHEITVPAVAQFEEEHERRNGFRRPGAPIEVIALRASARLPAPVDISRLGPPSSARAGSVVGPAVVAEPDCTVWVAPGWSAEVGGGGSWILRPSRS